MKKTLMTGAALAALVAGSVSAQDLSGETITVAGAWLSPESEVIESIFDVFEAKTGATVKYVGSDSFEQQIIIDAEAAN